jgi:hypothetical protein
MSTRRKFIQSVPAAGAAFVVAGQIVLDDLPAIAQTAAPIDGHFHPKEKRLLEVGEDKEAVGNVVPING